MTDTATNAAANGVDDTTPRLKISIEGGIAALELYNPKAGNSLTRNIYVQLRDAWEALEKNPEVKVITFTASGDRFFCTGADVSALKSQGSLRLPGEATGEGWRLTWRMAGITKPVVVAVNGTVAGGGLGFVTDGDIVFASRNAKFVDTHVQVGQICGYGALRLVNIIGPSEAKRIAIGGGALSAERAYQLGLVNELFDTPAEAVAAARKTAEVIASASPTAVQKTFDMMIGLSHPSHEAAIVAKADKNLDAHMSHPDSTEGAKAWMEKRKPNWAPVS
ncbi:MAG: Enoyl-CoA hydratase/isomerase [Hydrocarboniphaga sp.]|uniref:enoyl-CoA hydratase/isomerase family protein n=1 Tax=Hydrocarboniphaga sp. TaxID=2033016 RepID=UPI002622F340|nr:enoyl-CoA hydratase/isomerase family protein [Hydrocarboniphaga sp.]MDB5970018.1 Enoyl-CoA hydratase/isomerase [Hydrocarboniphaga sp.]